MPSREDKCLARWCRRADPAALAELFDLTAPRLLRLALHLAGDAAEAEDLVQASFVALIEQRASLDPARPAWPWLAAVLANQARDLRRRRARRVDGRALHAREIEQPGAALESRERAAELLRALDRLEEPYRRALVLHLCHGLSAVEIAHALGRSAATVRVQLQRGRERLRRILPAALAGSLLAASAPRGLAAARDRILAAAAAPEAAGAVTTATLTGALLLDTKLALGSAGVLIACVALVAWPRERGAPAERALLPSARVELREPLMAPPVLAAAAAELGARAQAPDRVGARRSVRGTVVDAETDEPIAGARLRLLAPRELPLFEALRASPDLYAIEPYGMARPLVSGDWPRIEAPEGNALARFGRGELLVYSGGAPGERTLAQATSDARGAFALPCGPEGGVLVCEHPGYDRRLRAAHDPAGDWSVSMWRPREVEGRVALAGGAPPGVPLELVLVGRQIDRSGTRSAPQTLGVWRTACDAAGRFHARIAGVPTLGEVPTPGWRPAPRPSSPGEELVLFVEPATVLRIADALSGAPIERVRLLARAGPYERVRAAGEHAAPAGRLELPGSGALWAQGADESARFTVWAQGYAPASLALARLHPPREHVLLLERGSAPELAGDVRRDGGPVRGAIVALVARERTGWRADDDGLADAARVDALGAFRLTAPAGEYVLRVDLDGERTLQPVELPAAGRVLVDLSRRARLEVLLVDEEGAAHVAHHIALRGADGRQEGAASDAEGIVRFTGLDAGSYELLAPLKSEHASFGVDRTLRIELAAGEARELRFEIPRVSDTIALRVVAPAAASFDGWAWRPGGGSWKKLALDGVLALERTGNPHVQLAAPDGRRWAAWLPRDERARHDLVLDSGGGSYLGRVTQDGKPLARLLVWAWSLESGSHAAIAGDWLDGDGRFRIDGLGPGVHWLALYASEDFEGQAERARFLPAEPASAHRELELELPSPWKERALRGRALRAEGLEPLPDALLHVESHEPVDGGAFVVLPRSARSDAEGRFELGLPATRSYLLRVDLPSGAVHEEWIDAGTSPGGEPVEVEILVD